MSESHLSLRHPAANPRQIKPPHLQPGDVVGIVSPAWGGAGAFPHRLERGVRQLGAMGFRVRIAAHALNQNGFVSDSAAHRAQDLHDFFRDDEVKLILAAIGGDHSCHLLPHLDFELMQRHPTLLMGFSDITVLNLAIWVKTGLTTFNGPALLTDFGEYPEIFDYTRDAFLRAVSQTEAIGPIQPSAWWTEEFLDWSGQKDLERPRSRTPYQGWSWLREGQAEGRLIGGCLESLQHLRGTPYWPDWEDSLLFIETSEEAPSVEKVDGILMDYENMGVFARIKGLLVGRPMKYSEAERESLRQVLLERTQAFGFPVVADMDFGHTAPQFSLPLGCRALIDTAQKRFEILESAVS